MNPTATAPSSASGNPAEQLGKYFHWCASAVTLALFALVLTEQFAHLRLPGRPGWPDALLIFAATVSTLTALARKLPVQNVLLGAAVIALVGGGAHGFGAAMAIPFGPFVYTDRVGLRILDQFAWMMPLLWVVAVLNSRGVARLILRPWRKLRVYGFWLIGITVALTVLFDVGLEPFAAVVKRYWLWQPNRIPVTWGSAPVSNFPGWLLTALLITAFATPALIDKRQQRSTNRPAEFHPLVLWLLAMLLFAVGAAQHQLWAAMIFCIATSILVTIFAVRGARW